MFEWVKGIRKAAQGAVVGTAAVRHWNQSLAEILATEEGSQCHLYVRFWRRVADSFLVKVKNDPNLNATRDLNEQRCAAYITILEKQILPRAPTEFSRHELMRIGEFIAFAVTRGLEEAIVVDPERASLIYDSLPSQWLLDAGLSPGVFDDLYFKSTGRENKHRF